MMRAFLNVLIFMFVLGMLGLQTGCATTGQGVMTEEEMRRSIEAVHDIQVDVVF